MPKFIAARWTRCYRCITNRQEQHRRALYGVWSPRPNMNGSKVIGANGWPLTHTHMHHALCCAVLCVVWLECLYLVHIQRVRNELNNALSCAAAQTKKKHNNIDTQRSKIMWTRTGNRFLFKQQQQEMALFFCSQFDVRSGRVGSLNIVFGPTPLCIQLKCDESILNIS